MTMFAANDTTSDVAYGVSNTATHHLEYCWIMLQQICICICTFFLYYGMARASVRLSGCLSVGLSAKIVNTIETEPFQLGPSNLVHILLMTRGRTLLNFKVRGQRSRSHAGYCC